MVDIAMCKRRDCPKKNTCFRYIAMPGEVQQYLSILDLMLDGDCEFYWRCRNPKELKLMNKLNKGETD